jgi:hypothetical protein
MVIIIVWRVVRDEQQAVVSAALPGKGMWLPDIG